MAKDLPGFYFDEEKRRYFPIVTGRPVSKPKHIVEKRTENVDYTSRSLFSRRQSSLSILELKFPNQITIVNKDIYSLGRQYRLVDSELELVKIISPETKIIRDFATESFYFAFLEPAEINDQFVKVDVFNKQNGVDYDSIVCLNYRFDVHFIELENQTFAFITMLNDLHQLRFRFGALESVLAEFKQEVRCFCFVSDCFFVGLTGSIVAKVATDREVTQYRLPKSSAKSFYYSKTLQSLLVLTFHNDLYRFDCDTGEVCEFLQLSDFTNCEADLQVKFLSVKQTELMILVNVGRSEVIAIDLLCPSNFQTLPTSSPIVQVEIYGEQIVIRT